MHGLGLARWRNIVIALIMRSKGEIASFPQLTGCSATLLSPLLQKYDVHNEEQWHEEARNQHKRETLHQTRVVQRPQQNCIQEIGDPEQVP